MEVRPVAHAHEAEVLRSVPCIDSISHVNQAFGSAELPRRTIPGISNAGASSPSIAKVYVQQTWIAVEIRVHGLL
jgi:hypothetical protein